jgi:glutamine synthetase
MSNDGADAARMFLDANPGLQSIELLLPDLNGILRGKRIPAGDLETLFRSGIAFPATGCLLDSRGSLIAGLPHGLRDGDPDYLCHPVPATLATVPWSRSPLAQCMLTMEHRDGRPFFADSRHLLATVVQRHADMGLTPVVAVEFEFYLLDDSAARPPPPHAGRVPGTGNRASGPRSYSLEDLHELDGFFAEVTAACAKQGLPAGGIVSEYGAGQFEVNLRHVPDAVAACDQAILLRRLIRGVAVNHGMAATFMAKPFAALDGSGMHVHVSLLDEKGRNVFGPVPPASQPSVYQPTLRHAIGGMLEAMPESLAIFCPNANSYRRIRPDCFAPIAPNWGPNHRQVAVRLPVADDQNVRFEHRTPGADCNPYLAVAAMLAAAHHGIVSRTEPPPMVREGEAAGEGVVLSPRWERALDAFDAARTLPAYLGREFCEVFGMARRFEAEEFHAEVSNLDYDWYLPSI